MRLATSLVAIGLAFSGTTAGAQAVAAPHPSVASGQPSFHIPLDLQPLRPAKESSLRDMSERTFESIRSWADEYTCPMPVAHTDTAKEDPMPVARGGTPVPMPVAKPACSNPLGIVH